MKEVFRDDRVTFDTVRGAAAAYVLIGLGFGSLFDFFHTLQPGSFQFNVDVPEGRSSAGAVSSSSVS